MHLLIACICILHVEHVDKEYVAAEAKDPEVVYLKEQHQEFGVADQFEEQEPVPEFNFANPESQPGKPRFINPRVLHNFKLYAI